MDAHEAIRRVLADPRAGQGGRYEDGRMSSHAYEDEPILRTGAELAAARREGLGQKLGVDAAREERREVRKQQRSRWPQTGRARQVARSMGGTWPGDDEVLASGEELGDEELSEEASSSDSVRLTHRDGSPYPRGSSSHAVPAHRPTPFDDAGGRIYGRGSSPEAVRAATAAYEDEPLPLSAEGLRRASSARPGGYGPAVRRVDEPMAPVRSWNADAWRDVVRPEPPLPEAYRVVRDFARGPEARRHSEAWVFRRQAEMLACVTDDCPYDGHFERYFPTYQAMTNAQLRGYVTWRTAVRQGDVRRTSPSFAYVYVFELLACVGTSTPSEAFDTLFAFWQAYRELDTTLDRHMRTWLRDFAAYYDIPVSAARQVPSIETELAFDAALDTVMHPDGHAPEERFEALSALSTYRIRSSRFAKDYPQDVTSVTLGVVSRLERHYASRRKLGLYETLFGRCMTRPYRMFDAAVFDERQPHLDAVYEFDGMNRYVCSDGMWSAEGLQGSRVASAKLGAVLKAVDARMRVRYGYAHPLREPEVPKYVAKFIEQETDAWLAWKEAHTPRRIEIDFSKLGDIRSVAAQTREELLVDEERGEEARGFEAAASRPVPSEPNAECALRDVHEQTAAERPTEVAGETLQHVAPETGGQPAAPKGVQPAASEGYACSEGESGPVGVPAVEAPARDCARSHAGAQLVPDSPEGSRT